MNKQRLRHVIFLVAAAAVLHGGPAVATQVETWPTRPITVVVPFPPGGGTDLVVRSIQPALQKELGQPLVIDNRGGAGGTIGAGIVAKAVADGYTLGVATTSTHALSASMYKTLTFKPDDFAYAGLIGTSPYVLVTTPGVPATDLKSFVALLKKDPKNYAFASVGQGTVSHILGEKFNKQVGSSATHIPYKGAAPAYTDLLAGAVNFMFDNPVGLAQYVRLGKLHALAATDSSALLVGVPTFAQLGFAGMDQSLWYGFAFPKATPPTIVARFNAALNKVLSDRAVVADLASKGVTVQTSTPQQMQANVAKDVQVWGQLVKTLGVSLD